MCSPSSPSPQLLHVLQSVPVSEEYLQYAGKGGAYLFIPEGEARPIVRRGGLSVVARGPVLSQVLSSFLFR